MIEDTAIYSLLEREEDLKNTLSKRFYLLAFDKWEKVRVQISQLLVSSTISLIVQKFNVILAHNPVNIAAFAHFLRSDVQSKNMHIRKRAIKRTEEVGFEPTDLVKGLLFSRQTHSATLPLFRIR